MKKYLKSLLYHLFQLIYKRYNPNNQSIKWLFLTAFLQKIIGINRSVPWPVHFTSYVKAHENIISKTESVGEAMGNYIDGRNGIILEENVSIGPKVSIISQNHDEVNFDIYIAERPIIIRKNCLLLTNCVILPGVELGEHTIVAAGAIVTKSFLEGNQIIGGIPAKVIKKIGDYNSNS
jgi:acetyltransferase-like isoleucine patch superfamily enzyme